MKIAQIFKKILSIGTPPEKDVLYKHIVKKKVPNESAEQLTITGFKKSLKNIFAHEDERIEFSRGTPSPPVKMATKKTPAKKKAVAKKTIVKKTTVKKAPTKAKTTTKKSITSTKTTATKKKTTATTKTAAAKKPVEKKVPAKKTVAKKPVAKKTVTKKADDSTTTKKATKKATTKATTTKKTVTKKQTTTIKKPVVKKPAEKKVVTKKPAARIPTKKVAESKTKTTTTVKKVPATKTSAGTKTKAAPRGAKKAEKIALYASDITKHYGEVDEDFLAIIVKNLGPSIYKRDSELVSCSDPKELDTVRKNFLMKKLGIEAGQKVLDAAIQDVCTELKATRTKYRATFYYSLAKKFKKESALS